MLNSDSGIAKTAGFLYLIIIFSAGFSEGYVRANLIAPGDVVATIDNIKNSVGLYRTGFVLDLIAFLSDLGVSIFLYILLKPVSRPLALIALFLRLLAHPAIASVNLLNYFAPLLILGDANLLSAFSPDQLQTLVSLFLNLHHTGYLVAGAFFGMHCLFLGYLLYKSDLFPAALGVLIGLAAIGYLIESFGNFLFPAGKDIYQWIVVAPAVVAELSLGLWLMIKGVKKTSQTHDSFSSTL